jgi:hypothetical protein
MKPRLCGFIRADARSDVQWKAKSKVQNMARGWESKSVEDQIASAAERKTSPRRVLTAEAREIESRKTGLLLSRAKIVSDIEKARDNRHREALHQALDYLDRQIEKL